MSSAPNPISETVECSGARARSRDNIAGEPACATQSLATPKIAVCVPVRDEREHLDALLAGLAKQTAGPQAFVLCLLFDGCEDGGDAFVRERAPMLPYRIVTRRIARAPRADAGRARRAAMALGRRVLNASPSAPADTLLLSTDADSVPAPDWIETSRAALAEVDIVAGYIERPDAPPQDVHRRVEHYWERLRCLQRTIDPVGHDPAPSHPSQGGASLGFRASVYAALGGFERVAAHEDVRLVTAARAAGYRVRHDRRVRVATSSRLAGRARHGLADTLRARHVETTLPTVEDPSAAAARYDLCAHARRAFTQLADDTVARALAATLALDLDRLREIAADCHNAEAFTMSLVPDNTTQDEIDLDRAEIRLAQLEQHYGCTSR
ncbi:glycosyltransferase [Salinisphaera aquimarina]|uniref:Glycosyltransferase n=1 Tax=Salinisphaera aquimarina TaxID=2094031 RepID=A0ABV7EM58_9GAMM